MKKDLELIEFKIDEENALRAVSIVKDPAIEKSFQLFKAANLHDNCKCEIIDGVLKTEPTACEYCKDKARMNSFKSVVEKKQITGPVMIPNIPILRMKDNGEYYNCWFSEETIVKASSIYLKNSNHTSANFDHKQLFTEDVYVIESWVVEDPELDKSKALGFTDVVKGTWFMTYKVDNDNLWEDIKKNGFTGFSIEGIFGQYEKQLKEQELVNKIKSVLLSNIPETDKESMIRKIIYTK